MILRLFTIHRRPAIEAWLAHRPHGIQTKSTQTQPCPDVTVDTPLMIEKAVGVRVPARSRRLRRRHLHSRPQPLHAASPTYPAAPTVKSRGYAEMEDTTTELPLLQPVSASAHALRSAGWRGRQACARDIFLGYRNGRSG
jgi:hypothetical protein